MKELLYAKNLVKSFGNGPERRRVLCGVSLEVAQGDFVSVMGPSGSGKSTLLFALSGMDGVEEGELVFEGQSILGMKEETLAELRRKRMGFVFQQPTMLKSLNILDNILLPSFREQRKKRAPLLERARELMAQTGIAGLEERGVTQVSGGQLQRAGICRALMGEPALIFADEPTGALNSKSAQEIMELFAKINAAGTAVVLVTHDARVAAHGKRVLFMHDGRIVSELPLGGLKGDEAGAGMASISKRMAELGI